MEQPELVRFCNWKHSTTGWKSWVILSTSVKSKSVKSRPKLLEIFARSRDFDGRLRSESYMKELNMHCNHVLYLCKSIQRNITILIMLIETQKCYFIRFIFPIK